MCREEGNIYTLWWLPDKTEVMMMGYEEEEEEEKEEEVEVEEVEKEEEEVEEMVVHMQEL